jgi:23S rRNA (uracil747-C5)-methyltransferase
VPENPFGSRAKAKLEVWGSSASPELGIVRRDARGDFSISPLPDCPLHHPDLNQIFGQVNALIGRFDLTPYDINTRRGELKSVSVVRTSEGVMVRFIARSTELKNNFKLAATDLCLSTPEVRVVSLNIQPVPHQIPEGEEEILLAGESMLRQQYRGFYLYLAPRSFVQVTPEIAEALYSTAKNWCEELNVIRALDVFCGAGGFLLSIAPSAGLGVEIKEDSIIGAKRAAFEQGYSGLEFMTADAGALSTDQDFDLVIANPPRRGLGEALCQTIRQVAPQYLLYSSCNPETLFEDIERLKDFSPVRVQAFDMFPLTEHLEVLCLMARH